jgi:hypothetical protein
MGQFIEILMNYKSLWKVGHHKDLSKWIALLSRFNNGNPLNKELITKIEDFFDYYWQNNRMSAIENEMDQRFMDELPYYVQGEIIIDYLFTDFLYAYRNYFVPANMQNDKNFKDAFQDQKMRNFLVDFVRTLEPRFYNQTNNDMIQDQYEEIFEVVYITKGAVGIGYRLFNEVFFGMQILMSKSKKIISVINDYSCLNNKCSEFLYQPIDHVEGFGMRRENFNRVMKDPMAKQLKLDIARNYKYTL